MEKPTVDLFITSDLGHVVYGFIESDSHPTKPKGSHVVTSRIVKRENGIIETMNTNYRIVETSESFDGHKAQMRKIFN